MRGREREKQNLRGKEGEKSKKRGREAKTEEGDRTGRKAGEK